MIFAEGNQKVYSVQKHKIRSYLDKIKPSDTVIIAYHGDGDGIISAAYILKYIKRKRIKKIKLYNFAELRWFEFKEIDKMVKNFNETRIIFIEGFGLPDIYSKFNEISINIDHHNYDNLVITNHLNPVSAKMTPVPATSLVIYDMLKDMLPRSYAWLAAAASIIDFFVEAGQLLIHETKSKFMKDFDLIRDTFMSLQYNKKYGDKMVNTLIEKSALTVFTNNNYFVNRRKKFNKKIDGLIKTICKKYDNNDSPIVYKVKAGDFRLASPLASKLSDIYKNRLIYIVEQFNKSKLIRISARFSGEGTDIGSIAQKIAKKYPKSDGIGNRFAASIRSQQRYQTAILNELMKYC